MREAESDSQELLIALQTLCWCPAHDGCNSTPLGGHQLGKMQKFLIFLPCPLCFLDGWVEPLVPAGLALFCRLSHKQGGDTCPLIEAILHHSGLEDFILQVRKGCTRIYPEVERHGIELYRSSFRHRQDKNVLTRLTSVFFHTPPLIIILMVATLLYSRGLCQSKARRTTSSALESMQRPSDPKESSRKVDASHKATSQQSVGARNRSSQNDAQPGHITGC